MKKLAFIICVFILSLQSCKNSVEKTVEIASETAEDMQETTSVNQIDITPISHATMVLAYEDVVIYVDPVGGNSIFADQETPNVVLITDIHGDHFDAETLKALDLSNARVIVPKAVANMLPELKTKEIVVMNNGETKTFDKFSIEAIPMYNLRKEALKFHEKGRGNGYVITMGGKRVYISGDTEDIPEMRSLKNIDIAFVCMNLPYTMTVDSAASAVLDFKPIKVYPYHYRGTEGLSDVKKFKSIVNKDNSDIEVVQLNWYQ